MAKTVSEGILRGIEAYSKARQARQGDLGDQLKMFETMRKLQAYNEPVPEGFVRLPDGTYKQRQLSPEEKINAQLEVARSLGPSGLPPGTRITGQGLSIPLNPKLTDDEKAAVAAQEVFVPTAQAMKESVRGGVFNSKRGKIGRTYRQFASSQFGPGSGLLTAYDKDLQALQGQVKSIRRYVFGEGGKQLTPYEANVVMGLIDPVGKSDEQYITDLGEATRIIESKARLTMGGANIAKVPSENQGLQVSVPRQSDVTEEEIQAAMSKYRLTREQVMAELRQ